MTPNYLHSRDLERTATQKPSKLDRVLREQQDKRETDALKRTVYREVDQLDERKCRCCGRHGNPYATTTLGRLHHAHLIDASLGGEMSIFNIYLLCWICHALVHAKQVFPIGLNARQVAFEIYEAAVVHVFGSDPLPKHVAIVLPNGERHL